MWKCSVVGIGDMNEILTIMVVIEGEGVGFLQPMSGSSVVGSFFLDS